MDLRAAGRTETISPRRDAPVIELGYISVQSVPEVSEAGFFPDASSGIFFILATGQPKLGGTTDAQAFVPEWDGRFFFGHRRRRTEKEGESNNEHP